jgi:putative ABC transport system ATP-binding protein
VTAVDAPPALVLRDVHKAFVSPAGTSVVLDGVDLVVAPGEVVAVAGRSGSGKTTLLTIVTGWERPDRGSVELGSTGPLAADRSWAELAILPQSLGLLDELTVGENVTLPLRLDPTIEGEDPDDLMARLGVDHLAGRFPNEVSLGEQQRAALARAVVVRPEVLVADEPISHQNREWAERMVAVLGELAAAGTACVLATHDEIAFAGADRVLDLRAGRLRPLDAPERGPEGRSGA